MKRNRDHPSKPSLEMKEVSDSKHHDASDKATATEDVNSLKQGSGDNFNSVQSEKVTGVKEKHQSKTGTWENRT